MQMCRRNMISQRYRQRAIQGRAGEAATPDLVTNRSRRRNSAFSPKRLDVVSLDANVPQGPGRDASGGRDPTRPVTYVEPRVSHPRPTVGRGTQGAAASPTSYERLKMRPPHSVAA